jgi:Tfp pilus assembly protein PilV
MNTSFTNTPRGFTLLVAVILTSVLLSVGLALAALAYKDVLLASSAKNSAYAFYAADSIMECALYADQQQDAFDYAAPAASMTCGGASYRIVQGAKDAATSTMTVSGISLDGGSTCGALSIYKGAPPYTHTLLFSVGLDTCNLSDPQLVERGLKSFY